MLDTASIHTCDLHHPQQNLQTSGSHISAPEAEFTDKFSRSYQQRFCQIHSGTTREQTLFVREVRVHGNGIADLVVLNWARGKAPRNKANFDLTQAKPIIRAFEVKLSNWRGGLMQAHRYKYFSHVAVLVVPQAKLKVIREHLDLFQTLRVGLWGFDFTTGTVKSIYTPRPRRQMIAKYSERALATVAHAASR